jgi:uncharacterized membrane protein YqhA
VQRRLQKFLESGLWNSRLLMIFAVVASIVAAIVMLYVASVDVVYLVRSAVHYADPSMGGEERAHLHGSIVARVAEVVDGYLFAAIMLIFGLGLYELFVRKVASEQTGGAPSFLAIRDLDDMKERLAKVVFLILLVRYFEYAVDQPINSPLDLLYLAVGIALVALAIYLTARISRSG